MLPKEREIERKFGTRYSSRKSEAVDVRKSASLHKFLREITQTHRKALPPVIHKWNCPRRTARLPIAALISRARKSPMHRAPRATPLFRSCKLSPARCRILCYLRFSLLLSDLYPQFGSITLKFTPIPPSRALLSLSRVSFSRVRKTRVFFFAA